MSPRERPCARGWGLPTLILHHIDGGCESARRVGCVPGCTRTAVGWFVLRAGRADGTFSVVSTRCVRIVKESTAVPTVLTHIDWHVCLCPTNAVLAPPRGELLVDSVLQAARAAWRRNHCWRVVYQMQGGNPHEEPKLLALNVPLFVPTKAGVDGLAIAQLQAAFPCTILLRSLSDVPEVRMLNRVVGAKDGVTLAPFLVPLLDATLCERRRWRVQRGVRSARTPRTCCGSGNSGVKLWDVDWCEGDFQCGDVP